MISSRIKDLKLRTKVHNTELNKSISKFIFVNLLGKKNLKKKLIYPLTNLINNKFSKTQLVRRCVLTNRARVSDRKIGISRVKLREMLKIGIFPGYKKAIW